MTPPPFAAPPAPPAPPTTPLPRPRPGQTSCLLTPQVKAFVDLMLSNAPQPASDPAVHDTLLKLSAMIVSTADGGVPLERMVREKNAQNPLFQFLHGGDGADHYQWQKFSCSLQAFRSKNSDAVQTHAVILSLFASHPVLADHFRQVQDWIRAKPFVDPPPEAPKPRYQVKTPSIAPVPPDSKEFELTVSEEDALDDILHALSGTQASIRKAREWFLSHASKAQDCAYLLLKFTKALPTAKQIFVVYLVSDILHKKLQASTKDLPEVVAVCSALEEATSAIVKFVHWDQDEDGKKKVDQVLDIWGTRNLFEKSFLDDIRSDIVHEPAVRKLMEDEERAQREREERELKQKEEQERREREERWSRPS
eukprot:TRINITY_DN5867_c0_g1_i1.p1 TRINITY_DN5867_c0_g1~~TRINITY_DN5867_c0_g1_i1.p1  ORF type:complete len:375 (-),score=61.46 TRINITY_DN5867_c0_g1_i1:46-1143(-)